MYITSQTLRTAVWTALALSAAHAQYVIDNLSFGQEGKQLSPNLRGIPHFAIKGESHDPDILTDRLILTPPYPGNKRGSIWAEDPLHHAGDWTAELQFRANGMERSGGNLQIWYTKESQKNDAPQSLYTAPKFDGLVLVIDQYEGRGGSIRGFLNDGTMDIKSHTDPDTLAFGQCDYPYRNLGILSELKLHHAHGVFEVKVDGRTCFSTDKVKLPEGYYFGISAASAEVPDSFEIFKFVVSTTNSYTREEPNKQWQNQQPMQSRQDQKQSNDYQQNHQQQQQQQKSETKLSDIPQMLSDVLAGNIRSQQDQFEDLHNRIQIINHRVDEIYNMVQGIQATNDHRFQQLMDRIVPMDDRGSATLRNMEKVERSTMDILRNVESKDFKDMLTAVHNAVQNSHDSLTQGLPLAVAQIAGKDRPSLTTYLFIAVAVQIMITGAYMVYKSRRNSAPKKYL